MRCSPRCRRPRSSRSWPARTTSTTRTGPPARKVSGSGSGSPWTPRRSWTSCTGSWGTSRRWPPTSSRRPAATTASTCAGPLTAGPLTAGPPKKRDARPGNSRAPAGQDGYMELSLRARVRAGDPDAFGVLFTAHAREVYNLGYRLRGSWPDAEEIVSLTFLEAWRLRERVNPDGDSLRPWLAGIAVNVTRNFSRTSRRHA